MIRIGQLGCKGKGKEMGNRHRRKVVPACLLAVIPFLVTSCIYFEGCGPRARYEKQVPLSAPLEPGSSFSAQTRDGSITVEGTETNECTVLATVVTHARTPERAEELAGQIHVKLEPSGEGLKIVIEKPRGIRNAGYSVSLEATVPTQTSLALVTSDGAVHITNMAGSIDARTSDGGIQVQDITGDAKLKTSDGAITCARLNAPMLDCYTSDGRIKLSDVMAGSCTARTSDGSITLEAVRADSMNLRTSDGAIQCRDVAAAETDCRTSDGSILIEYATDAPNALNLSAVTSDGKITLAAPPGLSAVIEATSNDGSIHTNLPITIQGKVGKSLTGTIGDGDGKVYLKTHDGSITIR
jgi:hypothetical protein